MEEDGTVVDAAAARGEIHSAAVVRSIEAKAPNRVLGTPAPAIDPEEEQLRRKTRRTLSQLRSGFCPSLEDYRHRVGLSESGICPCCRREEHTVLRTGGAHRAADGRSTPCSTCSSALTTPLTFDPWTSGCTLSEQRSSSGPCLSSTSQKKRGPPQNHPFLSPPTTTERTLGY